jgi:multiple sugar transport system ATP-binding protein
MAGLVLKNIKKIYDNKTEVIKNLSLEIINGEFLVLVGPSGCGKSTILRLIAGLENISSGEIFIGEKKVNDVHPKDRDIAMVFQNYALYPHMSVYDNMAFGLKMRKLKKDIIDHRVREASKILDMETYLDRKPKQLSGGQRQRVALGRAIVREPQVFLMDEPLSNLDAKLRIQTRFEIKKLHKKLSTTFIYVTHDQVEAMTMGDRIVILDKGQIQQVGTPHDIYNHPENMFTAGFIGSPSMNFIEAEVIDNQNLKIGEIMLSLHEKIQKIIDNNSLRNKNIILGIRPEYFSCAGENSFNLKIIPDLVEVLGSEKLLHFTLNNTRIIAKLPSETLCVQGNEIHLTFDMSRIILFDKDSGKSFR